MHTWGWKIRGCFGTEQREGESWKSNLKMLLCVFCIAPDVYGTQTTDTDTHDMR